MEKIKFHEEVKRYVERFPSSNEEEILEFIHTFDSPDEEKKRLHSEFLIDSEENILVLPHPFVANQMDSAHTHNYFELVYVSQGSASQTINGKRMDLKEGDICILSPQASHTIGIDHPSDVMFNIMIRESLFKESFLCLIAENDLLSRFFITSLFTMNEEHSYLYFPRSREGRCEELLQSLIMEYLKKDLGHKKTVECYLALLFTELLREHKEQLDRKNYKIMGNHQLSDILSYINKNKSTATLQSVAKAFHYHPAYLSSLVKKHTRKSFSEILQETRMQEACYYLRNTQMAVDEIAQLVGYYDRSYFHRVFKKQYGMTPNEYKEGEKEDF